MKLAALLLSICWLLSLAATAQTTHVVTGVVKDSAGAVIESATVKLQAGDDSLLTFTNKKGRFTLENIKTPGCTLVVSSTGYEAFSANYEFKKDQPVLELEPIVLKIKVHELKEVVVKSVIVPVTVKEDTVEYDARAYTVRDGDFVDDLLKQLPVVEVDKDGNVKAEGKEMTKLRVNGQDFFTNDVTAFIKQLPANLISKLQVIEDYGDEANFTGIKTGQPRKMLNLVTKPGMNKGVFGNVTGSAGTHGIISGAANSNIWRDTKQISINANVSHADKESLVSNNNSASASYRDNWGKKLSFNVDYNYNNGRSNSTGSTYNETIYPTGSLYTNSSYATRNLSQSHNLQLGLNLNRDKSNYFSVHSNIGYNSGNNSNASTSSQKGLVFQDLQNTGFSSQSTPSFSGAASYSHRFKKPGRVVSVSFNTGQSHNNNSRQLLDHTQYYRDSLRTFIKDSVLERLVESKNGSANVNVSISYSEPINKNNYFDFSYNCNSATSNSALITNVSKTGGMYALVDSLSNSYHNIAGYQAFAFNYRYTSKTINSTAGLQVQPSIIVGEYLGAKEGVHNTSVNIAPIANLRITISKTSSANINYNGQSRAPSINELQPVKDTRNLQNIIVGNPDLKTSFHHSLNVSYHKSLSENGGFLTAGFNGSTVRNQVVTDLHLLNDTITRSFKQETHYRNVNGSYNVGGNFTVSQPFFKRQLTLDYSGHLGFSRAISYADNVLNVGNNVQLSQSIRFQVYTKQLGLNGSVQYISNKNNYSSGINRNIFMETWTYNLATSFVFFKTVRVGVDASKQAGKGFYQSIANNPLYLNSNVSFSFLKKNAASVRIQMNDILNQGNVPIRMITGNSITDSRTTNITRYVLLTFSIRLNKFGERQ